ncbi:hypothetical protein CDL15_Pgr012051 [Punica granatum]|uniref:Uncharacterized protein n=1 Tax=Punica granatum TaxID=22663 RepID=A0A218XMT1_PUNGR|nr:hypothetical protein CDL15_Pgr012051 [Punica granatum]
MDPSPAHTTPDHEEDEWGTVLSLHNDGFVIPSLEIGETVPEERDDPHLETSTATSPKAKKEENIYLGPHGAPPSQSKQQVANSSNNRKQRFKQKLKEADGRIKGSRRENKVESLRELVGSGPRLNPNMSKGSSRDWLDSHCQESQFEKKWHPQ